MSDQPVQTFVQGNRVLEIHYDYCAQNPREFESNLGVMVCFDRNRHGDEHSFNTPEDLLEFFKQEGKKIACILSVYMYSHSGVILNTSGFSDSWDSGQIGWIYCTQERVNELGFKMPKKLKERFAKLSEYLSTEVELYSQYCGGDVYRYEIYTRRKCSECGHEIREEEDECGGFYGDNWKENGLFEHANWNPEIINVPNTEEIPA
jgi:hypothetical protein